MSTAMKWKLRLEDLSLVVPVTTMFILQIPAVTAAECAKVRHALAWDGDMQSLKQKLYLTWNLFTECDWRERHRDFHKIFKATHPQKERSTNEQQYVHVWSNNNIFCGEGLTERPAITGCTGNILKVASVSPVTLWPDSLVMLP